MPKELRPAKYHSSIPYPHRSAWISGSTPFIRFATPPLEMIPTT